MKTRHYWLTSILFVSCLILIGHASLADDTCTFQVTADDLPPNIVILLDTGAEMEHTAWHSGYDNDTDYTPNAAELDKKDVVPNGASGNGFYNDNGYGIVSRGADYYLVKVLDTLELDSYENGLNIGSGTYGGRTLSVEPSTVDVDDVQDRASHFRYSKNYLNWIFFSTGAGSYVDTSSVDDGSDLPNMSRLYYAKKAIRTVIAQSDNKAKFGIYYFNSDQGATRAQPLKLALEGTPGSLTLKSEFDNRIDAMQTQNYSPLAEGLATVGGYYAGNDAGIEDEIDAYCQKLFVIVVTPGVSSEDTDGFDNQYVPQNADFSDLDGDGTDRTFTLDSHDNIVSVTTEGTLTIDSTTYTIPTNVDGTTWLDDIAYWYYENDVVPEGVAEGHQNVSTYTLGFMASAASTVFLKNVSNLGNGVADPDNSSDPDYGKYHFQADSPDDVATQLLAAVNSIISQTSSFTAPVVPVTRTTSGNRIYMAFFKPSDSSIFWEGKVTKFGLSSTNQIVDYQGGTATYANGALLETAIPYWDTINWSAESAPDTPCDNRMDNRTGQADPPSRNIYTYMGGYTDLTHDNNAFVSTNPALTAAVLGNPTHSTSYIINYVRGADVDDDDGDGSTTDNRALITGDVLHSEPLVVYYNSSTTVVYFGANDGMLHAVDDSTGKELWGFIPTDQLGRLKDMVEGASHEYYIDSSPKIYFDDVNADGEVDASNDTVILVCGERKGGNAYFALDVTDPTSPEFAWWMTQANNISYCAVELESVTGTFVDNEALTGDSGGSATAYGGLIGGSLLFYDGISTNFSENEVVTSASGSGTVVTVYCPEPDTVISELGETWSEPQLGLVKTTNNESDTGTAVFFVGGGYSSDNSKGKTILAINALTGAVIKQFVDIDSDGDSSSDMTYCIPSSVYLVDGDSNGFVDKLYVGDLGSQMWRIGKFTSSGGSALTFPSTDENINNWSDSNAKILFEAASDNSRKFYYPPSVVREYGFDLVYMGTGDREDACSKTTSDKICCVKDTHGSTTFGVTNLLDSASYTPTLSDETANVDGIGGVDQGWYLSLAAGEKVLAENTVYYKTLYITTFTPNDDPCLPGGVGKLYALDYLTGAAVIDFDGDSSNDKSVSLGGGIPSKPVTVITSSGEKLFISVGSTLADNDVNTDETFDAGIIAVDPLAPPINFYKMWWKEIIPQGGS